MGKEKKQADLIKGMGQEFRKIQKQFNLAPGDFPNMDEFVSKLQVRVVRSNSRCVGCVGCLLTPRGASEIARVFVCVQQMCRRQRTLERGKAPEQELGVECVLLVLFYSSTLLPLITSTCNPTAIPLVDGLKN